MAAPSFPADGHRDRILASGERRRLLDSQRGTQTLVHAAAGHGIDYEPCVPSARQELDEQIRRTGDAYRRLKAVFNELQARIGGENPDPRSPENLKLQYLCAHVAMYEQVRAVRVALYGQLELRQDLGHNCDHSYRGLRTWLKNLETTYEDLIGWQDWQFVQCYERTQDWIRANPKIAASIAAGVVGGVAGASAGFNFCAEWCIVSWFIEGCPASCGVVSLGTSALFGAVATLFLVAIGLGLHELRKRGRPKVTEAERQKFVELERMMKAVERSVTVLSLEAMEKDIWRMAAKADRWNDFRPGDDDAKCPVCLEDMVEERLQPVRFSGCQGRHFHCFDCWRACQRRGYTCPLCRG